MPPRSQKISDADDDSSKVPPDDESNDRVDKFFARLVKERLQIKVTSISLSTEAGFENDENPFIIHSAFYKDLAEAAANRSVALDRPAKKSILLIVHGFNVNFESSLKDAARYAVDLNAPAGYINSKDQPIGEGVYSLGQPLLFTWPTTELGDGVVLDAARGFFDLGKTAESIICYNDLAAKLNKDYELDPKQFRAQLVTGIASCGGSGLGGAALSAIDKLVENYIDAASGRSVVTAAYFREFFLKLLTSDETRGINEINIMAHSMGNKVLADAFNALTVEDIKLIKDKANRGLTIRIISAAADADHDKFRDALQGKLVGALPSTPAVAIYGNIDDSALFASRLINGAPRVGRPELNKTDDELFFQFNTKPLSEPRNGQIIKADGYANGFLDLLGSHNYAARNPSILADSACFFRGESPERDRYLAYNTTIRAWEWDAKLESRDKACIPVTLPPVDCRKSVAKWLSMFPDGIIDRLPTNWREEADSCDVKVDIETTFGPRPAKVEFTEIDFGALSFTCARSDTVAPQANARCTERPFASPPLEGSMSLGIALNERADELCNAEALLIVGSASSFGDDKEALGGKRAMAIAEGARTLCNQKGRRHVPGLFMLDLGQAGCNGKSKCGLDDDAAGDRALTVYLVKDRRPPWEKVLQLGVDTLQEEISYLLSEKKSFPPGSLIERSAAGEFIQNGASWILDEPPLILAQIAPLPRPQERIRKLVVSD